MIPAHRIEAVLGEDGKLVLEDLPFRAGQAVEVIVLPASRPTSPGHALRGTVLRYDQPTASVAEADWGALREGEAGAAADPWTYPHRPNGSLLR
jgi:hypothetical protein